MKQNNRSSVFPGTLTPVHYLLIAGSLCLFLVLRWNSFSVPLERDEGEYAYSAWQMRHHGTTYTDAFIQKPPMIVYMYMFGQSIAEDSVVLPRLLANVFLYLSMLGIGLIAALERGPAAGVAALWFMVPMLSVPALAPFAANTELFMLLPLTGLLLLYRWKRGDAKWTHWLLAGCCAAFACLFKPIAAPVILFIVLVWAAETWKTGNKASLAKYQLPAFLLGGIVTTALVLFPFLLMDGGKAFWECVVRYNMLYAAYDYPDGIQFGYYLTIFWQEWWPLILLLAFSIVKRSPQWWFFTGLLAVSLLTIYRTPHGHYYIMIIPYLAIIAAAAIVTAIPEGEKKTQQQRKALRFGAVLIIVLILVLQHGALPFKSHEGFIKELYGEQNPFIEAVPLAEKIASLTQPGDTVFIAGSEPEVLYYAKRANSSRFIIMYPLMIPTTVALQYQKETIAALEDHPPKVLVFVRAPTSWLKQPGSSNLLWNYITKTTQTRYQFLGGVLYDEKIWVDHPTDAQAQRCSMVLYTKLDTTGSKQN